MSLFNDDDFQMMMDRADKYKDRLYEELSRLNAEPCMKPMKVGDHVLVAVGLIGRGHPWERRECVVLEVSDTAVKIRCPNDLGKRWTEWVLNTLVTDVLGQ